MARVLPPSRCGEERVSDKKHGRSDGRWGCGEGGVGSMDTTSWTKEASGMSYQKIPQTYTKVK
jgi:hypothetical protein